MKIAERRSVWTIVAIVTLAGLMLRGFAARGGLWLDEAWSAIFAQEIATPAGVLLQINHDNNHHLNTLWLQLVGRDAPPLAQRALSIVSGSATIPVAAAVALRRGWVPAVLAAVAFAFAPFLVTYGSEARGYAPMLFAWVVAIALGDRWLDDPTAPPPATGIALAAMIGCLAQATMVFGLAALGGWVVVERLRIAGFRTALRDTLRLLGPAAVATIALIAIGWGASAASASGFHFGNREPHDWWKWALAIDQLWAWTLGLSLAVVPLALCGLVVRDRMMTLAFWAGAALPLAVALFALPNSGASRYYAVAVPPLLLWASIALSAAWAAARGWRTVALAVGLCFLIAAASRDAAMVTNLRGDPARAIDTLATVAPGGAVVATDLSRSNAILIAGARSHGYVVAIPTADCPAAPFRFVERDGSAAFPAPLVRCGRAYREIARGDPTGLSGTHWRLYARTG